MCAFSLSLPKCTKFGKFELDAPVRHNSTQTADAVTKACHHHLAYSYPLGVGAAFVSALPGLPHQLRMVIQALGVDEIDVTHVKLSVNTMSDGRYFRLYSQDERAANQANRNVVCVPRGGANARVRTPGGPWKMVRIMALPVIKVGTFIAGFIAGFEWERVAAPAITSAHQDLHLHHNPPSRPVLLQLTDDLEVEQCAVSFDPEMDPQPKHVRVGDMGAQVDPWACICTPENPPVGLTDAQFKSAVSVAKQVYDSIVLKMQANPDLLEVAVKKLGKERGVGPHTMKVADLRTALCRLGESTKGKKAQLADRLSRALADFGDSADRDSGLLEELSVAE